MRFKERAKRKKFTTPVPSEHSSSEDVPSLEPMQLGDTSAPPPSPSPSVPVPTEAPTDRFTSIEAENAYRNTFSKRPVLGEREVSIHDFPSDDFQIIRQIFIERGWEKLTHALPTPCVEVVREFYSNIAHFNLDDHSIISTVRGIQIEVSPAILRNLFTLPEVESPLYPYKGMGAPTKTAMRNLFVGLTGPKWTAKTHRLPLHNMLPQYRLLAKIVLTNLWPISRHTEISLERAYFMYALATSVSIDFPRHVIDIIHRSHVEKELNLPFGSLITQLAIIAKVPLRANEPTMKLPGPISALTVVKSAAVITKKRSLNTESASSPPEPSIPTSQLLEQLTLLSQKMDSFTAKWEASQSKLEQQLAAVRSDCVQANDRLVQLSLDVQHIMASVADSDEEV
ncbi:hypothetical protein CIPAW_09G056200 [Carya illinoinensis]|uniref:Putative plant transposon protein domain-containing protein n=1 Tax=Carya illinoinensis TaxID=32201 RepID=A0A8T1PLA4_CARIL|nr:hypothetical protein CIPAW_09G056200 [Carya illinoinensis]